jgi:uncharacterized protein with ParB-like and HNH nuclease domain
MIADLIAQLNEQKRKVDFDSFDITVKELVSMVADSYIDIAPEYQRQFRWKDDRQSALVESVFLGIPIPSLFMAANADGYPSVELLCGRSIRSLPESSPRSLLDRRPAFEEP